MGLVAKVVDSNQVKTDLTNQKLEDRMKVISECSASRLLNGVNHIWSEQICESREDVDEDTPMSDAEAMQQAAEIREVAAREDAMNGIIVDESREDNPIGDDKDSKLDGVPLPKYCLTNPWTEGANQMAKSNHLEVKKMAEKRRDRKRTVARFIVAKVKELEAQDTFVVGKEHMNALPSPWSQLIHGLDPNYYAA